MKYKLYNVYNSFNSIFEKNLNYFFIQYIKEKC